jgi:hypothetical protein
VTKGTRDALWMFAIVVLSLAGLWLLFNLRLDDAPPTSPAPSASSSTANDAR